MENSTIKFGFGQYFKNPTPDKIRTVVKTATVVLAALGVWVGGTSLISLVAKSEIAQVLSGLIALIHAIAPLWGVEIDTPTVPADKVTAIKE